MKNSNPHRHQKYNPFDNPEHFIEKFEGPRRDEWQKPDEVIASLALPENGVVVEVGAGTGYFAVRLAEQVKKGNVITFDQSVGMTEYLAKRVKELGLKNVQVQTAMDGGQKHSEIVEKADVIFSVDVYHHMHNRIEYFSDLLETLTPTGKLVIIDRTEEKVEGHPHGHRIPAGQVKREMSQAGFKLVEELDFLQPIQYYLVFMPAV